MLGHASHMKKLNITPALQQMERFIGFTIPRGGKFFVCDHDEVVRVPIDGSIAPEISDEHPYQFVENNSDFLGIVFDGLLKNEPILRVESSAIS